MDAWIPIVTVSALYILARVLLVLTARKLSEKLGGSYRFIHPLVHPLHWLLLAVALWFGCRLVAPVPQLVVQLLYLAAAWLGVRLVTTLLYEGWFGTVKDIHLPEVARRLISLLLMFALGLGYLHFGLGYSPTELAIVTVGTALILMVGFRGFLRDAFLCISLVMERRVALGDWIAVDGQAGQIISLDWRSTTLRNDRGEHVVLPNRRLADLPLTNAGPKSRRAVSIEAALPAEVAPSAAMAVIAAAAQHARVTLNEPSPKVVYLGEREGQNRFEVTFWVPDSIDADLARSEVRSNVWYRLRRTGLVGTPLPDLPQEVVRQALSKVPLLKTATPEQVDRLARRIRTERFGEGELLFRRNEAGNELFMVHSGALDICLPGPDDVEHKVASMGAGDIVGEHSLLGEPRSATVRASEDSVVLVIDKQAVGDLLLSDSRLADEIAETILRREEHRQSAMRDVEARKDRSSRSLTRQIRRFFVLDRSA